MKGQNSIFLIKIRGLVFLHHRDPKSKILLKSVRLCKVSRPIINEKNIKNISKTLLMALLYIFNALLFLIVQT